MQKRALSGIKPTGDLHLGNYLGAIHEFLELQSQPDFVNYYFIADYHALNSNPDPVKLREHTLDIFKAYIAFGLDPEKSTIFVQSHVPEHVELSWLLTGLIPMGLLERAHAYKDSLSNGRAINVGLFSYPVLMAADILIYDATVVPVGADQKQHVEITRDIAEKFNNLYGDTLTIPEPMIRPEVAIVPGTDGGKMSKSKGNVIPLFGKKDEIKRQIMGILTDSTPLESPKDPDSCNVFKIYKLLAPPSDVNTMREKYLAGGYGYGHAKKDLLEAFLTFFTPAREKMEELNNAPDEVERLMTLGAEKARAYAAAKILQVRKAIGLS
ncbi:MAG: tryptophan--tRNA ligase [Brevinema sp.]